MFCMQKERPHRFDVSLKVSTGTTSSGYRRNQVHQSDAGKEQQDWSVLTLNHQTTLLIQGTVQLSGNPVIRKLIQGHQYLLCPVEQPWSFSYIRACPLHTAYIHRRNSGCAWACAGRSTVSTAKKVAILVDSGGIRPALLGRNWLGQIKLDWHNINHVQSTFMDQTYKLFLVNTQVFLPQGWDHEYFCFNQHDTRDSPKVFKHRPVLYALREEVEEDVKESLRRWM